MRQEWQAYLARRAPRYTSYPAAPYFHGGVRAADYRTKLGAVPVYEPLSLYIHIPFCRQLCWYCGCNMRVENVYERTKPYLDALCREIATVGAALKGRGRTVNLHFGGGTPNYFRPHDLERILTRVEEGPGLTDDAGLAIELDPRLVQPGDIPALKALGFTRLSMGIQDFNPAVQAAINRHQSFALIESLVGQIRRTGFEDLSFDILYGLPKQTRQSFDATLDQVVHLNPDRISVFGYAHLPAALPRQRLIDDADLPDEEMRMALAEQADEHLCAAGYQRIGFDHYARPGTPIAEAVRTGRLKRNFQGFTEDQADTILGFGASAIGFIDGLYVQNEKDIRTYAETARGGALPIVKGLQRTPLQDLTARIISDLLCRLTADLAPLFAALPASRAAEICTGLKPFIRDGLLAISGTRLMLCPDAAPLARLVAMTIDPEAGRAPAQPAQFSKVV